MDSFPIGKYQSCLLIFLIAIGVRLATLNQMGKTWDEPPYVETGFRYVELAVKGDFNNPFWYLQSDHPPLARYVYGLASVLDIKSISSDKVEFNYNYTYPRIASALLGSLSAIFVVLIGFRYFSPYVGFSSGIIFVLIPFFVGLSQTATLESFIMFFFTGSVYFYLRSVTTNKYKYVILTGIFCGLAMLVKQSNILIYPLLAVLFGLQFLYQKKRWQGLSNKLAKLIIIGSTSIATFFILWPMPFFHYTEIIAVQKTMWVDAVKLPPPEVFFGRLMLVPLPYYFLMFLVTTPILLLALSFIGALKIDRKRTFIPIAILIWFLFPFIQSFYAFKQHGVRYIIELYAPFALLSGIGLSYVNSWFGKVRYFKYISLFIVSVYLLLSLVRVSPYYLDYFSEVVGGNNNIYEKRLFQMGWWGQGIGEAIFYIDKLEKNTVSVAVDGGQPEIVVPKLKGIKLVYYSKDADADYVLVPYFNVVRLWFPEHELKGKYKEVHSVMINKAKLVKIYKRIR